MVAAYKKDLIRQIKDAMGEVYAEYNVEVDRVIESENEFADLGFVNQDIVDTMRLLNSKVVLTQEDLGAIITIMIVTWAPISPENGFPYGPAVWRGFFAWGRKFIEGRHWDTRAAKNIDVTRNFVNKLRRRGVNAKVVFDNISSLP